MARRSSRRDEDDYLPDERDEIEDEEEEERPRRRRRASRDEDEEEDRPRRRRVARDDDEDDDEEEARPRRRSRRDEGDDDEDEEEDRPRRSSSRGERSSTRPARGRRSRDDDDDDDAPRRTIKNARGWGHTRRVKKKTSTYAKAWRVGPDEGEALIKFLEDEPFASYGVHWFDEVRRGKRGWICMETLPDPEECPACDSGDTSVRFRTLFSIAVIDPDTGEPRAEIMEAGRWLSDQLEKISEGRNGPLSKHYWAISATGGGKSGPVKYDLQVVKERDIEDDWGIEPLDPEELDELAEKERTLDEIETIPSLRDYKAFIRSLDD